MAFLDRLKNAFRAAKFPLELKLFATVATKQGLPVVVAAVHLHKTTQFVEVQLDDEMLVDITNESGKVVGLHLGLLSQSALTERMQTQRRVHWLFEQLDGDLAAMGKLRDFLDGKTTLATSVTESGRYDA